MNFTVKTKSNERRDFIISVASYYAQELNIHNFKWTVNVVLTKRLLHDQKSYGMVCETDNRTITLLLYSYMSMPGLLKTLAHEMVHVKQIVRGQYKGRQSANGKILRIWRGKVVRARYEKQPWEIEAVAKELILVENLLKMIAANKTNQI